MNKGAIRARPVLYQDTSHRGLKDEGQHLGGQHNTRAVANGSTDQQECVISHVRVDVKVRKLLQALERLLDHRGKQLACTASQSLPVEGWC